MTTLAAEFTGTWNLRQGADFSDAAATKVAAEIERLKDKIGRMPEAPDVLAIAKSQRSPLHNYFDWSDTEAAGRWRQHQANVLLGALKVRVMMGTTAVLTPLYPSVRVAGGAASERQRVSIHQMTPNEGELLKQQAAADLRGFMRRHASVLVALGLEGRAEALVATIERAIKQAA